MTFNREIPKYRICNKGGHDKPMDEHRVCDEHRGTRGGPTHCNVCAKPMRDPGAWGRGWVHVECLAVNR